MKVALMIIVLLVTFSSGCIRGNKEYSLTKAEIIKLDDANSKIKDVEQYLVEWRRSFYDRVNRINSEKKEIIKTIEERLNLKSRKYKIIEGKVIIENKE